MDKEGDVNSLQRIVERKQGVKNIVDSIKKVTEEPSTKNIRKNRRIEINLINTHNAIADKIQDTNPLLGLYARQTLKSDLLSSTELENDRVGVNDHRRKEKSVKTITEFSLSPNPLLAQEVFTGTKRNLLEAGETYSDEFILDNVNKVIKPKINSEKNEDELLAMTIKRIRRNRKHS